PFTDDDPGGVAGDYTATIFWGDGANSSAGTVVSDGHGGFTVSGSYTYAEEGTFPISVSILDTGGASIGASATATVADAGLTASAKTVSPTEGAAFSGVVASFIDADPNGIVADYSATITWGDGHSSAGTIAANASGCDVRGLNNSVEEGRYPVAVSILDTGGAGIGASSTATVADAGLTASAKTVTPTEGAPFSGVVASFTDADPAGTATDYSATIYWADGHSPDGTITGNGSGIDVSGSNTYA